MVPLVLVWLRVARFSSEFLEGSLSFFQIVQHFNEDLFPVSPNSASRICLLVMAGSLTPTLFQLKG